MSDAARPNASPQQGLTIDQAMAEAHARWNAGQAQHAEMLCRQVLAAWPGHPDALHLLGLMAHAFGNLDAAIDYLREACRATRPIPVYFANLEKFPAIHEFGVLLGQVSNKSALRNLVFGEGGAWTDGPVIQAAQRLQLWAQSGYFPKSVNAGKYNDSPSAFAKGEGVFLIGGPWFAADLAAKMGSKVRFMLPPPPNTGDAQPATLGGPGLPLAITSKSKHPDVAAAYLNFMTSPQAMDVVVQTGGLPAARPASAEPATPVGRDVLNAYRVASDKDLLVPYLDYATTTFLDTLGGALQEVIAGRTSPAEAMAKAQRDYGAFLAKK